MKVKSLLLLIVLVGSLISLSPAVASVSFEVSPVKESISVPPGASISVPVRVTNTGDRPLANLTLSIVWNLENGLYAVNKTVYVGVNESKVFDLTINVPELSPGDYEVTIRGISGNISVEREMTIHVEREVAYSLDVDVGSGYPYGSDVEIRFSLVSHSNDRIAGTIWIKVYLEGEIIEEKEESVYLDPGEGWSYPMVIPRPDIGTYRVKLSANLSGVYREIEKTFVVYRRNFTYRAWYSNGALMVQVKLANGSPVGGVEVSVNGVKMKTDEDGLVRYPTTSPGLYEIELNLDGVLEKTALYVGRLFVSYELRGSTLELKVLDSNGDPVPNVTLSIAGPEGEYQVVTDENGEASTSLDIVGYGTLSITASAENYVGSSLIITVPSPFHLTSTTSAPQTTTTANQLTTTNATQGNYTPVEGGREGIDWVFLGSVLLGLVIFGGSFYFTFLRPHLIEEELGEYYFVKLRAPRLVPLRNFTWEKGMNAVEVRTTRGEARIEGSKVTWRIDELKPGEEAVLQVVLG